MSLTAGVTLITQSNFDSMIVVGILTLTGRRWQSKEMKGKVIYGMTDGKQRHCVKMDDPDLYAIVT